MTKAQEDFARIAVKGLIAQGNLVTTKDGTFLRSFNPDTNKFEPYKCHL